MNGQQRGVRRFELFVHLVVELPVGRLRLKACS